MNNLEYYQVLDMDPMKWMTMYSCQERVQYQDKNTNKIISYEDLWEFVKNKEAITKDTQNQVKENRLVFEFEDNVEVFPTYKQRVNIFQRPTKTSEDSEVWTWAEDKNERALLEEQLANLNELFPELDVNTNVVEQVHNESCDYSPYKLAYERQVAREDAAREA